jgi:hypothetical protein
MALKDDFPAIDAGFTFVLPSYTWLLTRIEAADGRLNQILTLASTITAGVTTVARAVRPNIAFSSGYFVMALLLFVGGAFWAIKGRLEGGVALPDPAFLYQQLDEQDDRFKATALFFAGKHYAKNAELATKKSNAAVVAAVCLTSEIVALIFWMWLS